MIHVGQLGEHGAVRCAVTALRHRGFSTRAVGVSQYRGWDGGLLPRRDRRLSSPPSGERLIGHRAILHVGVHRIWASAIWNGESWLYDTEHRFHLHGRSCAIVLRADSAAEWFALTCDETRAAQRGNCPSPHPNAGAVVSDTVHRTTAAFSSSTAT